MTRQALGGTTVSTWRPADVRINRGLGAAAHILSSPRIIVICDPQTFVPGMLVKSPDSFMFTVGKLGAPLVITLRT